MYFLFCFCWKNEIYIVHKWGCRGGLPPETAHREHQIKWLFWFFFVAGTASFKIEKKSRTSEEMRSLLGYILQICLWEKILEDGGGGGGGGGLKSDFLRKVIPARNFLKLFQFLCCAIRSTTGKSVITRRDIGSDRIQNFSINCDLWQFFCDFWRFSEMIDFDLWPPPEKLFAVEK